MDVLLEFEPGHVPGLVGLASMDEELCRLLGRRVDLVTPKALDHRLRPRILASAEVEYADGTR